MTHTKKTSLLTIALVTLAGAARAEGTESAPQATIAKPTPTGAATPPPAVQPSGIPPHRLSELVSLQLEDADLSDLVRVVGQVTGKRFLIASPRLAKLKASLYAPEKVTAQEAYQALLAVLTANGLTVVPSGGFYRIVESENIARQVVPLDQSEKGSPEERYITRIHRLKHLSAEEVATGVLSKLATKDASIVPYAAGNLLIMTETGANLRRMMEIVDAIDQPGTDAKLYFQPLSHVSSGMAEKLLNELLDLKKKDAAMPGASLYVGRLVAVERPNALIIVATEASYQRIFELLARIDIVEPNETQVHVVALQHADAKKIVGPLAAAIGSPAPSQGARAPGAPGATTTSGSVGQVLEGPAQISADDTTNSLIVTAGPRDFANIKEVIAALDKPKRQVFIEAVILDISDSSGLDLGVAWHGGNVDKSSKGNTTEFGGWRAGSSALPPSTSDLQGLALGIRGPDIPFNTGIPGITTIPSLGAFLTAAASTKGADILSTPSITASDNTPAEIKVQLNSSLQPHAPQPAQYLTGGASLPQTSTGVTANYKAIGPRVKITPHLNDSDEVRLDIEEVISDIASEPGANDTYGTISYIERAATTTMTVKDGSTAVIGGLVRNIMRRSESKVPILGDIPVLGVLFRTRSDQMEKSNLILILTPYIIRGEEDMRRIAERKKEERQVLIDHAAVFSDNAGWKPPVDYRRTHGLLTQIAQESRAIERDRREREAVPPKDSGGPIAVAPMELPLPISPSQGAAPIAPKPTEKAAAGPQLRTVEK